MNKAPNHIEWERRNKSKFLRNMQNICINVRETFQRRLIHLQNKLHPSFTLSDSLHLVLRLICSMTEIVVSLILMPYRNRRKISLSNADLHHCQFPKKLVLYSLQVRMFIYLWNIYIHLFMKYAQLTRWISI